MNLTRRNINGLLCAAALGVHASAVLATTIAPIPLTERVAKSSDIAVAELEIREVRKADGKVATKGKFRTAPGLNVTPVASLKIVRVLKGSALKPGEIRRIDLWSMWHDDVDLDLRPSPAPQVIVFLRPAGNVLVPFSHPDPYIDVREEADVKALINERRR